MSLTGRVLTLCSLAVLAALAPVASAWAEDANMTLYVFKKGLPQRYIEVLVDGVVVDATNEQGVAIFDLQPGVRMLELRDQDLVVLDQQILATEGEVSQWIVNITSGLSSLVDVESSAAGAETLAGTQEADHEQTGAPGWLSGQLTSADDGQPIRGARIFVSGQSADLRSDDEGRFEIEVASGTYSVSVLHAQFNTQTRDGIEVPPDGVAELELELTPSGSELPEFVVIEPYIAGSLASVLEERRNELAVANFLGSEQISKSGDSDAAGALRRVTGLTLVDGRFIYIRGLGERYSSTLLNGANVPSPDPTRRVVPLDLFPTSIIDSVAVKKGYTASLPGEFGGGVVEIRTKSLPEASFLQFEIGAGYRDGTTFKEGLLYDGGGSDWTGRDDGTRAVPPEMAAAIAGPTELLPFNAFTGVGFSPEELQEIGRSLDPNYDLTRPEIDPNYNANLSGGWTTDLTPDIRFGLLASLEWKDSWLTTRQIERDLVLGAGQELIPLSETEIEQTFRSINFSAFFTTGIELSENHTLGYNWMLLRNTTDEGRSRIGTDQDIVGGLLFIRQLEWTEREMKANQLKGEHLFPKAAGLKVEWQWTDANATSVIPDRRDYRYLPDRLTPEEDDFIFPLDRGSVVRSWADLDDSSTNWNLDFTQPIELSDSTELTVITGFNEVDKSRESVLRKFSFRSRGAISQDLDLRRNLSLGDVIFDPTIDPQGWEFFEATGTNDNYSAGSRTEAVHLGFDLSIGEAWRFGGGFRDEDFFQEVITLDIFGDDPIRDESVIESKDRFPYATFTWIGGDHQIRGGFSETTNRPDFKEVADVIYRDPVLDRLISGNPDLKSAFITHYDLRWDYYFNPGEFISFGLFYKEFIDPIEFVAIASADSGLTSLDNAESAENFGFEFELYKTLEFMHEKLEWPEWWANVYVNTNYAWIESDIRIGESQQSIQTSTSRPLQGQSPYVWNFQVGYDDEDRGINAALLYNVFGARIVDVGILGAPDSFEQPRPSLDFVYAQSFGKWRLKGKIKNILDPDIEITQGDEIRRGIQAVGMEFSVGVEYRID